MVPPWGAHPASCRGRAAKDWLERAHIKEGFPFRGVDRHGYHPALPSVNVLKLYGLVEKTKHRLSLVERIACCNRRKVVRIRAFVFTSPESAMDLSHPFALTIAFYDGRISRSAATPSDSLPVA